MRVSPEKARMAAREYVRTHGGGDFGGANYHFVIFDNEYHFAPMYGKDSLILYGYFVDGNTGKVSKGRVHPFWLPFESNPDIRRAVQMTVVAKDRDSR